MAGKWGEVARKSGEWLVAAWLIAAGLIAAGLVALYFGIDRTTKPYRGSPSRGRTGWPLRLRTRLPEWPDPPHFLVCGVQAMPRRTWPYDRGRRASGVDDDLRRRFTANPDDYSDRKFFSGALLRWI